MNKPLFLCLVICVYGLGATAAPLLRNSQEACTGNEKFEWDNSLPKGLRTLLLTKPGSPEKAIEAWLLALETRRGTTDVEAQKVVEFAAWKLAVAAGWIHPAQAGLSRLWKRATGSRNLGLRKGILQCLQSIHAEYKSLDLAPELQEYLNDPQPEFFVDDKEALKALFLRDVVGRLGTSSAQGSQVIAQKAKRLKLSGPEITLALLFARFGEGNILPSEIKRVLSNSRSPVVARVKGFLHLMAARAHSKVGKFREAVTEYEQVTPDSDWFETAQAEKAWAYLNAKQFGKAIGTAYSLRRHKGFVPDPLLVASIAFLENCHYADARRALKIFKEKYIDTYVWLREWRANPKSGQGPELYKVAIGFAKEPTSLPAPLGYHFVTSPVFQSAQTELNQVLEEVEAFSRYQTRWRTEGSRGVSAPTLTAARSILEGSSRLLRSRETALITKIGDGLLATNQQMVATLSELIRAGQWVRIESLTGAGEEMVQGPARDMASEDEEEGENSKEWKWGKRPAMTRATDEVWADEEGLFQADIKNLCAK